MKKKPIVAIVGRANVGKSTLWNRLTETKQAIVSPQPHTTRDRNYKEVTWRGASIEMVDTGGMDAEQGSEVGRGILQQAKLAIKDADLVLFLVDSHVGILAVDRDLARHVRELNKHVVVIVNKLDKGAPLANQTMTDAYALGFGDPEPCSAATGKNTGDVLDRVYEELNKLGKAPQPIESEEGLKLVVMGRPNVGKSSLVNAILGEERVITSPVAHTTREPIDTPFMWHDERVTLVDTAGMRRRSRIEAGIEEESMERNKQALNRADIAVLVLDATEEPSQQDKHLAGLLKDETKGLIIAVNKWDLIGEKDTYTAREHEARIRQSFPFLSWAPMMFVSAIKHQRSDAILEMAFKIREERRRQIAYNALQRLLKTVVARKKPLPESGAYSPHIHDIAQIGIEPPTFLITVRGQKETVHVSWVRYFENRLREKFGYMGTPVVVKARNVPIQRREETAKGPDGKPKKPRRKRPIGRKGGRY